MFFPCFDSSPEKIIYSFSSQGALIGQTLIQMLLPQPVHLFVFIFVIPTTPSLIFLLSPVS